MIFFFPIEIKIRELLGKVFLAYQLVKKNNEVIIGGQRDIPVNISKIKNCFWFDKNTYYKKINLKTNMIYKDKNIIGMFDEEGPVSFFPKLTSETRYPKQLIKYFNIFYYWGKNDLGNLNKTLSSANNNFIVGHNKYDLLKKPYVNIWNEKVKKIRKKYKNIVFFSSSFRLKPKKEELRKGYIILRDNINDKKKLKNFLKNREKLYKLEEKNYFKLIKLFKDLSLNNPNNTFVYRPHPNEDFKKTIKDFSNTPRNLKIIFKDLVTPWIIASDIYLHSGCTTSLEAAVLRKKIICFMPYGKTQRHKNYSKFGFFFDKSEPCRNFIEKIIKNKLNPKNLNLHLISNIILNFKNKKFFYKEFIDSIKTQKFYHYKSEFILAKKLKKYSKFFYQLKMSFIKVLSEIKDKIVLKTPLIYFLSQKYIYSKDNRKRKFDTLEANELKNILNKIKQSEKSDIKINIKKITKNVYKIYKA